MKKLSGNWHLYGLDFLLKKISKSRLKNESDVDFGARTLEIFRFLSNLTEENLPTLYLLQEFVRYLNYHKLGIIFQMDCNNLTTLSCDFSPCNYNPICLSTSGKGLSYTISVPSGDRYHERKIWLLVEKHKEVSGLITHDQIHIPVIPSIALFRIRSLIGEIADTFY